VKVAINAKNNMRERDPHGKRGNHNESQQHVPSEKFRAQVDSFVGKLEGFNDKLPQERQRSPEDFAYLRQFFPDFIEDRDRRAEEVSSDEYKEVVEISEKLLPLVPYFVMCMDGRVKPVHAFGFTARIGGSIRTPGAVLKGFYRNSDGELQLDENSDFAEHLVEASKRNNGRMAEIFDAHYACAARKKEEASRGLSPGDAGLFQDVFLKKEMVSATRKFVSERYGDSSAAAFIQTTFNPITGFLYMGLETDEAMVFAREFATKKAAAERKPVEVVYSKEVLKALIQNGLMISTAALSENPTVRRAFDEHFFNIDLENDYVNGARKLWLGLASMKNSLLPIFEESLLRIYPELNNNSDTVRQDLEERAMLLLCSAYIGYLNNPKHDVIRFLEMTDKEYEKEHNYAYDGHTEEGVLISEGCHPPYDITMFVIFSGDENDISAGTEFASEIVRGNRLMGRVENGASGFENKQKFTEAPVPVVMQEIIRDGRLTEDDWDALRQIDWSDLPNNWDTMSTDAFAKYVERKGKLPNSLSSGLERLRRRAARIYAKDSVSATHLSELCETVLPIVSREDRETQAVIPLVKLGH
jgi:hypothetical protein